MAAKPKGTIAVSGELHFGGFVVYDYTWTGTQDPWALLEVTQDGAPVQRTYSRLAGGIPDKSDPLGPTPSWLGGAADAVVELGYWVRGSRWTPVASASFPVGV